LARVQRALRAPDRVVLDAARPAPVGSAACAGTMLKDLSNSPLGPGLTAKLASRPAAPPAPRSPPRSPPPPPAPAPGASVVRARLRRDAHPPSGLLPRRRAQRHGGADAAIEGRGRVLDHRAQV